MSAIPPELPNTAPLEAPPVLLPYQARWVADPAKVKIAEKSRRTGFTWGEAADDVLIAALEKPAGGQNVWYIGYTLDMAKEYIDACAMWARAYNRAASAIEQEILEDEDKQIRTYIIRFDSGHRITALSSRPTNLRGKQGVVVIDEAAFHDDLQGLLKAALALLIWGGKVRIISTHNGDTNPFNELILECRAGKAPYSVHRLDFHQALTEGLYRRVCLRSAKPDAADEAAWTTRSMPSTATTPPRSSTSSLQRRGCVPVARSSSAAWPTTSRSALRRRERLRRAAAARARRRGRGLVRGDARARARAPRPEHRPRLRLGLRALG